MTWPVNAMSDTTAVPPIPSEYSDDAEMVDIVEMFVEDMPRRLEALAAAWECVDVECLRRLAHQLKGAAAGYGSTVTVPDMPLPPGSPWATQ